MLEPSAESHRIGSEPVIAARALVMVTALFDSIAELDDLSSGSSDDSVHGTNRTAEGAIAGKSVGDDTGADKRRVDSVDVAVARRARSRRGRPGREGGSR